MRRASWILASLVGSTVAGAVPGRASADVAPADPEPAAADPSTASGRHAVAADPGAPGPPTSGTAAARPAASSAPPSDPARRTPPPRDEPTFAHEGGIFDLRVGAIGCIERICRRHRALPGPRIDATLGVDIEGWVDVAATGGWGMMLTEVAPGTNALSLYGLDVDTLPRQVDEVLDLSRFEVQDAGLDTAQAGLAVRVHVLPQGRFDPYFGTGVGYHLFRARYDTAEGRTWLGFHGLYVPLQAGLAVFVHENVALGAQFDWLFAWYGAVTVRGAAGRLLAPISAVRQTAALMGTRLPGDLPFFWSAGALLHLRFGRS